MLAAAQQSVSTTIEGSNLFRPPNVHVGVCHWIWRPMCLAPRYVPNKPVEFLSTRSYLADCTGVVQWSELFVSQTDSSMPAKSGCLKVNVVFLTDCVLKQSLVVVVLSVQLFFLAVQFSAVHCAVHMHSPHNLDID